MTRTTNKDTSTVADTTQKTATTTTKPSGGNDGNDVLKDTQAVATDDSEYNNPRLPKDVVINPLRIFTAC